MYRSTPELAQALPPRYVKLTFTRRAASAGRGLPCGMSAGRTLAPAWRWATVGLLVAILVSLPWAIGRIPARGADTSATTQLQRILASDDVGYSGYAEAQGGVSLPVTSQFTELTDLLGQRTRLRVWWRTTTDWRIDTVTPGGEVGLHRDSRGTWEWNYEDNVATRVDLAVEPAIRLPRAADLVPPDLARRLLATATEEEISTLPAVRIAGRSAVGLVMRPQATGSTIGRIEVWSDERTGLPMRVSVYGKGADTPVMTTSFLDLTISKPDASVTAFTPPPGARTETDRDVDLAAAINRFGGVTPPATLGGLPRYDPTGALGSVGVYGVGVTTFTAIPLPGRNASSLRRELINAPGAVVDGDRVTITDGVLSLLITESMAGRTWLLTGTVDASLLTTAAEQLRTNPPAGPPGRR
jgi:outer membrane lipoprotein-sorting protein